MNLLAVDYGTKHIGLAYADSDQRLVFPLEPLEVKSEEQALAGLISVIKQRNIHRVVLGLPFSFQFEETSFCQVIRDFASKLEASAGIEVVFVNEVLSSDLANEITGRKQKNHSVSAQIILADYLTKNWEYNG